MKPVRNIRATYLQNKSAIVGDICYCPACGQPFKKRSYQQVFCKTKPKTQCKDKYWNTVTPHKRNNTTRISPASAAWLDRMARSLDEEHPFSCEGLGQWTD